jgi:DNA-binding transcriptional MerR regulator
MGQYSIKDLETLSGVKAHTIRIWEQRYNLLQPERTDTNIRFYCDEDLKHLLNVSLLNKNGIKISTIADMSEDEIRHKALDIVSDNKEPNVLLESLMHSMLDFDEQRFEKALNTAIMNGGFQKAFSDLLLTLLQRVGFLWTTGVVKPSQEHFMTNLIRRKLATAIDNRYVEKTEKSKKYVLFLPEGEQHEILLLFSEYLLRINNHQVAYIGSSVPFDEIGFVRTKFKPDVLLTFITVPIQYYSLQSFVDKLSTSFPDLEVLVGGAQMDIIKPTLPQNVKHIKSLDDLCAYVQ